MLASRESVRERSTARYCYLLSKICSTAIRSKVAKTLLALQSQAAAREVMGEDYSRRAGVRHLYSFIRCPAPAYSRIVTPLTRRGRTRDSWTASPRYAHSIWLTIAAALSRSRAILRAVCAGASNTPENASSKRLEVGGSHAANCQVSRYHTGKRSRDCLHCG